MTAENPVALTSEQEQAMRIFNSQAQLPQKKISNRYAGLNVLGLVADNSACGYYRVVNPLHLLKLHGANVDYGSHHSLDNFLKYDIIIAPRQYSEEVYEILRFVMWDGKCVIFEIDDDLDAVEPSSPAYFAYHPGSSELKWIHKVMSWCDGVTTTTREMARWCYKNNRNVGIIENYIDFGFRDWDVDVTYFNGYPTLTPRPLKRPEEWKDKVVIMWAGGTTHQLDLKLMGPQIKTLLNKYSEAHFAMYASPTQADEFLQEFSIPQDRVTLVPARHFLDYPVGLNGADIGLCPLVCNQFNLAKSFLKPLEYFAKGIVPVTSNVGPYCRFNTRHPGYVVNTGDGATCIGKTLVEGVEFLLQNPDELQRRKVAGRQLVMDKYSLEKNIDMWPQTWATIQKAKMSGNVGPPEDLKQKSHYVTLGSAGPNDKCPCGSDLKYKNCCKNGFG